MPSHLPLYGLPCILDRLMNHNGPAALPVTEDIAALRIPPVQIVEDEGAVHVRALVPGVAPDKLSLTLEGNVLSIRGEIPAPRGTQLRRERATGPFRRELRLPCLVADEPINASLRNGILTLLLPKSAATGKRSIRVDGPSGA